MTVQRLHPNLAAVDLLTAKEINESMGHQFDAYLRDKYRGMKVVKLPVVAATATGTTLNLAGSPPGEYTGPDQGFIWQVRKVMVASSSLIDSATYALYVGSDNQNYDNRHLLEGFQGANGFFPATPTVTASPYTYVNTNPFGVNYTVTGGTVSAITLNGTNVGATSGTFYVAPGSALAITYTVVPAVAVAAVPGQTRVSAGQFVNVGWYPASNCWLFPGEQIYSQITFSVPGNNYVITGLAYEVPAEMQGKLM